MDVFQDNAQWPQREQCGLIRQPEDSVWCFFVHQNEPESVFQIARTFNRDQGRLEAGRDLSL